jgi:hypothetical protein
MRKVMLALTTAAVLAAPLAVVGTASAATVIDTPGCATKAEYDSVKVRVPGHGTFPGMTRLAVRRVFDTDGSTYSLTGPQGPYHIRAMQRKYVICKTDGSGYVLVSYLAGPGEAWRAEQKLFHR